MQNATQVNSSTSPARRWFSAKYFCEQASVCLSAGLGHWQSVPFEMRSSDNQQLAFQSLSLARAQFLQAATHIGSIHFYLEYGTAVNTNALYILYTAFAAPCVYCHVV